MELASEESLASKTSVRVSYSQYYVDIKLTEYWWRHVYTRIVRTCRQTHFSWNGAHGATHVNDQ